MSARKVFSLSLDRDVVERVDAKLAGASRSRLVEELLAGWVEQGDGAVRRPVTSAPGGPLLAMRGAVPEPASRPPAEPVRERPVRSKVDRDVGDGTPLPAIAPRWWV